MLTTSPFWPLDPGVPSNPSSLVSLCEEISPQRSEKRTHHHLFTVTIYLPQQFHVIYQYLNSEVLIYY